MTREVAFAELYQAHYRQVRAFCRQLLGSAERAEDAAQEAFTRAYRSLASYDRSQPFAGWVMRIARNHCLDVVRRRGTERGIFGSEAVETAAAQDSELDGLAELLTAERARAVQAAVAA
ncbi:MAG TPA: sigma-70 family RNA polymerase sigma factor, partial [Vicinamibacterales bacterium]|nr:sigma-70 family RNA polymerase sigma factor [Vicinamibacterales bacterium]